MPASPFLDTSRVRTGVPASAVPPMLATVLLWASAFVTIRLALADYGPAGLTAGRLAVAAAVLGLVALPLGVRRPHRRDFTRVMACGAAGMAGYQLLLNAGERTVDAGTASVLVNSGPLFAAAIAFVFLRERLGRRGWAGIAIGAAGATIVVSGDSPSLTPSLGALLVLGAAVAQASFFVLQQPLLQRYTPLEVTCYATWAGLLLAVPLLPALATDLATAAPGPTAALVFLGVGPSAVGFLAWAGVQARSEVGIAATTLYLVPPVSVALGAVLLDEDVAATVLVGGAITIIGVVVSRSRGRARRAAPERAAP